MAPNRMKMSLLLPSAVPDLRGFCLGGMCTDADTFVFFSPKLLYMSCLISAKLACR